MKIIVRFLLIGKSGQIKDSNSLLATTVYMIEITACDEKTHCQATWSLSYWERILPSGSYTVTLTLTATEIRDRFTEAKKATER